VNQTENEDVGTEIDEDRICELLRAGLEEIAEDEGLGRVRTRTFEDEGLLTSNKGIVIRIGHSEWQVTVVQSR